MANDRRADKRNRHAKLAAENSRNKAIHERLEQTGKDLKAAREKSAANIADKNAKAKQAAGGSNAGSKEKVAYAIKASSSMDAVSSGFDLSLNEGDREPQHIDMLDIYAVRIIDLLQGGVYNTAMLARNELCVLYRYFFRNNPIMGRIIDLHTDIPLSKLNLTAPQAAPEIAKDYIQQFYQRILTRVKFPELVREMVISHWVYGEANVLVNDIYEGDRELRLPDTSETQVNPKLKELLEVEAKYKKDPASVAVPERLQYLQDKFLNSFDAKYTGPSSLRVIPFHEVTNYLENRDIGYKALELSVSESLQNLLNEDVTVSDLVGMGYSKGFLELAAKKKLAEGDKIGRVDSIEVDNDHEYGSAFIFSLEKADRTSIIHRVLQECLAWDAAYKALKAKIKAIGKVGRVVTASELSVDQIDILRAEVEAMIEDPDYALVANYEVSWEEVNSFVKEELQELANSTDSLKELLALALGMPMSMLSGEGSYSGDSIKLELINTAYAAFKNNLSLAIEEGLFKPIALRKGFITQDEWGNEQLLYPKISLSRVSLRDDAVNDMLFSLYQKGSLPVDIILDLLNIDPDEVTRGLEKEVFTFKDANFNNLLSDLLAQAASDIYAETDLKGRLIRALNLRVADAPQVGEGDQQ